METATAASPVHRLCYGGSVFQIPDEDLQVMAELTGRPLLLCEFGACEHVELTPSGLPKGFNASCIYVPPEGLAWEIDMHDGNGFSPYRRRCDSSDRWAVECMKSGNFDDYKA